MADLLKVLLDWLETEERVRRIVASRRLDRAWKPRPRIFLAMSAVPTDRLNQV